MKKILWNPLVFVFSSLIACSSYAENLDSGNSTIGGCEWETREKTCLWRNPDSFRFDNDVFYSRSNDDQNYTYGLIWDWSSNKARQHYLHTESLQNVLFDKISWISSDYSTDYHYQFGLTNFTPDNLSSLELVSDDRPYANLLYSTSEIYRIRNNESWGIGVTLGLIGTDIGEILQSGDHALVRKVSNSSTPVDPKGWDHQISDGGEPTAKIDFSYHRRLVSSSYIDIAVSTGMELGYYRSARAGIVAKMGIVNNKSPPNYLAI